MKSNDTAMGIIWQYYNKMIYVQYGSMRFGDLCFLRIACCSTAFFLMTNPRNEARMRGIAWKDVPHLLFLGICVLFVVRFFQSRRLATVGVERRMFGTSCLLSLGVLTVLC